MRSTTLQTLSGCATYAIAAAFIAAPLSREEAGVGEDAVLWAGVTGGGASTDLQRVRIQAGEVTVAVIGIDDSDGWACPWLYVYDGGSFQRRTEILRNLNSPRLESAETTPIGTVTLVDGYIVVRIAEEKDEVSYIDALALVVGDKTARAENAPSVAAADGDYLTLSQGDTIELRFRAPESLAADSPVSVS